jgi:hypothetical protein
LRPRSGRRSEQCGNDSSALEPGGSST